LFDERAEIKKGDDLYRLGGERVARPARSMNVSDG
jgi:hypothetical protein